MKKYIFSILFSVVAVLAAGPARAAVLSVQTDKNVFNIGDEFIVSVKINSEGVAINAAQANLSYPTGILQAESADKSNSIFNFWLTDPTFSNSAGTLTFTAGSTSGYTGQSLNIFSVKFKVVGAGRASIKFLDGAITASDGSGTNVLKLLQGVEILSASGTAVTAAPATPPPAATGTTVSGQPIALPPQILPPPVQIVRTPVAAPNSPAAPKIRVPLYPVDGEWSNIAANFLVQWNLPADITDVATAVNSNPKFDPTQSEGLFDNKFFPALKEGISYLHIRFKNNIGWGATAHYKIRMDTVPPAAFNISVEGSIGQDGTIDNPAPTIDFHSADQLSGLQKYSVQIDNNAAEDTKNEKIVLPLQKPGKHTVRVVAYDFAGNGAEARITVDILPIKSPLITSVTNRAYVNEGGINIAGTSATGTVVALTLKSSIGEILAAKEVPVDANGGWAAKFDASLKKGNYFVGAVARDKRGAESFEVKSETIRVAARPVLRIFGLELSEGWFFTLVIFILLAGFGAGYLTYHLWRTQMGRKVIIARRDVAGVLGSMEKDLDWLLENYNDNKIDEREAKEMHEVLKRIKTRVAKMGRYLSESIEEIAD